MYEFLGATFLYRELEIRKSRRDGLLEILDAVSIYGHECVHEWMQIYFSNEPVLYLYGAILTPSPIPTKLAFEISCTCLIHVPFVIDFYSEHE